MCLEYWKGPKGHAHRGHSENVLKVKEFRVFSVCFQGAYRDFSGIFRVFFPMPFVGTPFRPFQAQETTTESFPDCYIHI